MERSKSLYPEWSSHHVSLL